MFAYLNKIKYIFTQINYLYHGKRSYGYKDYTEDKEET